jgi:hypothetical protein
MTKQTKLGGSFTLPGTPIKLVRMGYGAMQLAGPEIWGNLRRRATGSRSHAYRGIPSGTMPTS